MQFFVERIQNKYILFVDQPTIIFRPDIELSHEPDEVYNGRIHSDELKIWAQERCIPLVRLVLQMKIDSTGNAVNENYFLCV